MSLDVGGFCEVEGAAVGGRVPVRDIGGLRSIYIASRIANKSVSCNLGSELYLPF